MSADGSADFSEKRKLSPFVELVGGQREEWSEGYVRISLVLKPHHTNPNGVMGVAVEIESAAQMERIAGVLVGDMGVAVRVASEFELQPPFA